MLMYVLYIFVNRRTVHLFSKLRRELRVYKTAFFAMGIVCVVGVVLLTTIYERSINILKGSVDFYEGYLERRQQTTVKGILPFERQP